MHCPESRNALATLEPVRKTLTIEGANSTSPLETTPPAPSAHPAAAIAKPDTVTMSPAPSLTATEPELKEQHFSIHYGDTGHSFDSLIGPYLKGATEVHVEDP